MVPIVIIDRALMGFSLAVHIVLAAIAIGLPLIIIGAEFLSIKYKDSYYRTLAKRLTTALILFFAVGTASGIIVAFELFLLWPNFITLIGQVAVIPPYMENFAFFTEAIFLAMYVYSENRFKNKYIRPLMLVPVVLGSAATAMFITFLNAFMNTPTGFNIATYLKNGTVTNVNPLAIFSTSSAWVEVAHVTSTTYFTGLFIFAAYFAFRLLRSKDERIGTYYKKALMLTTFLLFFATVASVLSGVQSIQNLYTSQPEKFAAIEADLAPMSNAPEYIGGLYINGSYRYYVTIPGLQSLLATGSINGTVPGLVSYPVSSWPPLYNIHLNFDIMVFGGFGIGLLMFAIAVLWIMKKEPFGNKIVLYLMILSGLVALYLLEAGWVMAETARQPWIVYNVMSVQQAANYSNSGLPIMIMLAIFYVVVLPLTMFVLQRRLSKRPLIKELSA